MCEKKKQVIRMHLMRMDVGLMETIPQNAAGARALPPISLPMPKSDPPAPMRLPSPPEDPPGVRSLL